MEIMFIFIFQSLVRAVKRRPQLRGDVISEVTANGFWRALTWRLEDSSGGD